MKFYRNMQAKESHGLAMAKHVHQHATLTDVAERAGGSFSGMEGLVELFADEVTNVADSKALIAT